MMTPRPWPARRRLSASPLVVPLLAALLWPVAPLPGGPPGLVAQEEFPTTRIYKRIAEAADGYRDGEVIWMVVENAFPHDHLAVFTSQEEAEEYWSEVGGDGFSIWGPIQTESDVGPEYGFEFGGPQLLIMGLGDCELHIPPSRCWVMDESPTPTVPFGAVDSLRLVVYYDDAAEPLEWLIPVPVDAMFLTASASDKFYLPYLARLYGVEFAAQVRRDLVDRLLEAQVLETERDPR